MVEPPWGVEPQTYALRVSSSSTAPCAPSPSAHVEKHTVHLEPHRRTPFEATKEATTMRRSPSRPCPGRRGAPACTRTSSARRDPFKRLDTACELRVPAPGTAVNPNF